MTDWAALVRTYLQQATENPSRNEDIVEELAQHLAEREAELLSAGLDATAARERTLGALSAWERLPIEIRRSDRERPMASVSPPAWSGANPCVAVWRDLLYAVRTLRKSPTYTAVAVTVLALGIGAATAFFSVVDAVVLRALPYEEPDRIMALRERDPKRADSYSVVAPPTYFDWRARQRSFEGLAAVAGVLVEIRDAQGHLRWHSSRKVTAEYFAVLRASPLLGRVITRDDEANRPGHVVVLSHGYWLERFGGRSDVVGQTLVVDDKPAEIIGVMPRAFTCQVIDSTRAADLFVPYAPPDADRQRGPRQERQLVVVGRLKPGVSTAQASDDMNRIAASLDAQYPTWAPGVRVDVVSLHDHRYGKFAAWTLTLFGAVAMVLLIACANIANLTLARASGRGREIAIRAALGASRAAIVRGLLVEALVLSVGGAAVGMLLAWGGVSAIRTWLPPALARVAHIAVDLRVLTSSVAAAAAIGVGFGIAPALHAARTNLVSALSGTSRSTTPGPSGNRLRYVLVVSEIALSAVLLVGAGLFVGSFAKLLRVDVGFDYRRVLTIVASSFGAGRQHDLEGTRRMLDAIDRVPGVLASTAVLGESLFTGIRQTTPVAIPGRADLPGAHAIIGVRSVLPNYHRLLGIPLVRGRFLADSDRLGATPVILVNQSAARAYWPGQDAVGQRLTIRREERVVVGVVGDVRNRGPEVPIGPECYLPLAQGTRAGQILLVRTSVDPTLVSRAVQAAIWSVNDDVPATGETSTL